MEIIPSIESSFTHKYHPDSQIKQTQLPKKNIRKCNVEKNVFHKKFQIDINKTKSFLNCLKKNIPVKLDNCNILMNKVGYNNEQTI